VRAGLAGARATTLAVLVPYTTYEQWWEGFAHGVGPAGSYVASLADGPREALRELCRQKLAPEEPAEPFEISAMAWTVTAPVI
jgi:hypothetical protein